MTPNWQQTTSNWASSKGGCIASACRQTIRVSGGWRLRARSSIGWAEIGDDIAGVTAQEGGEGARHDACPRRRLENGGGLRGAAMRRARSSA